MKEMKREEKKLKRMARGAQEEKSSGLTFDTDYLRAVRLDSSSLTL